jgi:hypothetical protein
MNFDAFGRYTIVILVFVIPVLLIREILRWLDLRDHGGAVIVAIGLSLFVPMRILFWLNWLEGRKTLEMFSCECIECGNIFWRQSSREPDRKFCGFGPKKAPSREEQSCDECLNRTNGCSGR